MCLHRLCFPHCPPMPRLWRLHQRGVGHWLLPFLCWATTTTVYVLHLYSFSSLPFSLRLSSSSSSSSGHYPGCPSAFLAPFAEMREGKGRRKEGGAESGHVPDTHPPLAAAVSLPGAFATRFLYFFSKKRSSSPFFQFTLSQGEPLITVKPGF